jgi:phage/plasmid-like protein (TIGR03299 family)
MSHNINENRMFCVGKAWHNIGQRVDKEVTAKKAIELARLDYQVEKRPIQTDNGIAIDDNFATIRTDTNQVLGIVGNRYHIIQNTQAFDFFDVLVGEGQAIYHSAGALGKGERIWLLTKLPEIMRIGNEDTVEKYLCLTNSFDGSKALQIYFTPIRVVCQNTLNVSLKNKSSSISIRHTQNYKSKLDEARRILGIVVDYYKQFENLANQLKDVKLNVEETGKYYDNLLNIKGNDEDSTRKINVKQELIGLYVNGTGANIPDVKRSLWTAYNSVAEYVDYYKTVKNNQRLESLLFGSGAELKNKAWNLAVKTLATV